MYSCIFGPRIHFNIIWLRQVVITLVLSAVSHFTHAEKLRALKANNSGGNCSYGQCVIFFLIKAFERCTKVLKFLSLETKCDDILIQKYESQIFQ